MNPPFAAALLAGTFPWAKLRQAQALLRLGEKYGWARVNASCQRALAFDLVNVRRLEHMLRADLETAPAPAAGDADVRVFPLREFNNQVQHVQVEASAPVRCDAPILSPPDHR